VKHCGSVAEARLTAEQERFDLLVSDIGLPDGSGVDLMTALRKTQDLRGIALSGFGTAEDVDASLAAGFAMHLTKPVDLDRLRTAIRTILRADAQASRGETADESPRENFPPVP
jgi:DNA-binding response OmpR family regulator